MPRRHFTSRDRFSLVVTSRRRLDPAASPLEFSSLAAAERRDRARTQGEDPSGIYCAPRNYSGIGKHLDLEFADRYLAPLFRHCFARARAHFVIEGGGGRKSPPDIAITEDRKTNVLSLSLSFLQDTRQDEFVYFIADREPQMGKAVNLICGK